VRKAAHGAIASVLVECATKLGKPSAGAGPAGTVAAKFVQTRLQEGMKDPKFALTSTLHILEFCRHVLWCFPAAQAKVCPIFYLFAKKIL
jgi:hypothetical protein